MTAVVATTSCNVNATYKIVNAVALVMVNPIGDKLPLESIAYTLRHLGSVKYEPKTFPGLIFKPVNVTGKAVLLFSSGKMVVAGAKSIEEIKDLVTRVVRNIRDYLKDGKVRIKIENIVVAGKMSLPLDVEYLSEKLPSEYDPDMFPGLIVSLYGLTALLFSNGKFVIPGIKSFSRIEESVERLVRTVADAICMGEVYLVVKREGE